MKLLFTFSSKFGTKLDLNPEFVVEKDLRFYLFNPALRKVAKSNFFTAGLFLGRIEGTMFYPSFNFLDILSSASSNKVVVDGKSAWLFICGRDILKRGVVKSSGSLRFGDYVLVHNEYGECLGYGVWAGDVKGENVRGVAVRNVLDIGDFLRRESC